jgi:hypothetical protein
MAKLLSETKQAIQKSLDLLERQLKQERGRSSG